MREGILARKGNEAAWDYRVKHRERTVVVWRDVGRGKGEGLMRDGRAGKG